MHELARPWVTGTSIPAASRSSSSRSNSRIRPARPLALRLVVEGEVGVDPFHPEARQALHLADVLEGVGQGHPEPPEPGVHLDVDRGGPTRPPLRPPMPPGRRRGRRRWA